MAAAALHCLSSASRCGAKRARQNPSLILTDSHASQHIHIAARCTQQTLCAAAACSCGGWGAQGGGGAPGAAPSAPAPAGKGQLVDHGLVVRAVVVQVEGGDIV